MSEKDSKIYIISFAEAPKALCGYDSSQQVRSLSGFSGSCAILIICGERKVIFVDSRYVLQAKKECKRFEVVECAPLVPDSPSIVQWIKENVPLQNADVFYFSRGLSHTQFVQFSDIFKPNRLQAIDDSAASSGEYKIEQYPLQYAGETFAEKKIKLMQKIRDIAAKYCNNSSKTHPEGNGGWGVLITSPESIAWLFNLREKKEFLCHGHSPTFPSIALLTLDNAFLILPANSVSFNTRYMEHAMIFQQKISAFESTLCDIINAQQLENIFYNESQISQYTFNILQAINCKSFNIDDYCMVLRGTKNYIEIENSKMVHKIEGAAVTKLLMWFDQQKLDGLTEYDIACKLENFRDESNLYMGKSFSSIVAFGKNSAIVHYCPTLDKCTTIKKENVLLIDVGGHYLGGTTDMTRTVWIGGATPPNNVKTAYTNVLKGHIALAIATFSRQTPGKELDKLARQFLLRDGKNYSHGTGHGIGNYLAVHEGPHSISTMSSGCLTKGMLVSNEPGFYEEGAFGIRLENIMLVEAGDVADSLKFVPLTLVPFAANMIDFDSLSQEEKLWLQQYHKHVEKNLYAVLNAKERAWLHKYVTPFYLNSAHICACF
ncbi:MAG: M24 family metallopeptidase [Holosporales bacterium]|jgi:Xaa-Pro aminopeptidase|nr:M24 family metallopeptidase [Holosporales bacterium]